MVTGDFGQFTGNPLATHWRPNHWRPLATWRLTGNQLATFTGDLANRGSSWSTSVIAVGGGCDLCGSRWLGGVHEPPATQAWGGWGAAPQGGGAPAGGAWWPRDARSRRFALSQKDLALSVFPTA